MDADKGPGRGLWWLAPCGGLMCSDPHDRDELDADMPAGTPTVAGTFDRAAKTFWSCRYQHLIGLDGETDDEVWDSLTRVIRHEAELIAAEAEWEAPI